MADQSGRERLDEGLRLMRAFFRIKDGERRRGVIDFAERTASHFPPGSERLHVVNGVTLEGEALTAGDS